MPEDSKALLDGRLMTKHELKRALSAKLRDPLTSARSFVNMMSIYVKLNPGWKRKPRQAKAETSVDDMVQKLELQQKQRQRHTKPM
jgi:hypothetical protein